MNRGLNGESSPLFPWRTRLPGSVNDETAVFVFNESKSDSPYASRIVLATEDTTNVVTRDMRPVALRACTDKTAVWIERDEDDGSGLTLVRMGVDGLLSESRLDGPTGIVASEFFSVLGCGKKTPIFHFLTNLVVRMFFSRWFKQETNLEA